MVQLTDQRKSARLGCQFLVRAVLTGKNVCTVVVEKLLANEHRHRLYCKAELKNDKKDAYFYVIVSQR